MMAMQPKGGSTINEDQVKAVAAYVWRISHGN
jgi:mono/diheme cytochrome c family protein